VPVDSPPAAFATLVVQNRLVQPIALTVGDSGFTIAPGDSTRIPVRAGQQVEAHWAMVRPDADGRMLGKELEGSFLADSVRGELRRDVNARTGGRGWYTPVVVNATSRMVGIAVIGARDSADCHCAIAPGDSLRLGYYPLEPGSAVRVTDKTGRTARFQSLSLLTDSVTGAAPIRVIAGMLRARVVQPAPTRRRPERPNPLRSFLPVH
jgi:hypothetical protein